MCEIDDPMDKEIKWAGWNTTFSTLKLYGWEVWNKPAYKSWYRNYDSEKESRAKNKIYLLNRKEQQLARVSYVHNDINDRTYWLVDYMMPVKRYVGKVKKMFEELTEDDIGWLLESVQEIQAKRPKRKKVKNESKENERTVYGFKIA